MKDIKLKWWQVLLFAFLLVLLACVFVFLVTRPHFFEWSNLSNLGTLGDALNGLTAPVISFISSILIFITLILQINANTAQNKISNELKEQVEFDMYFRLFNEIQQELKSTTFTRLGKTEYTGSEAINEFTQTATAYAKGDSIGIMGDIAYALEDISSLINNILSSNLSEEKKQLLLNRINLFYISKLEKQLKIIMVALEKYTSAYSYHIGCIVLVQMNMKKLRQNLKIIIPEE